MKLLKDTKFYLHFMVLYDKLLMLRNCDGPLLHLY